MILENIIQTIETVTGITPVVKGGNRENPVEYMWSRIGLRNYRLEIWLHGEDMLAMQEASDLIVTNINDFGDTVRFNGSIELSGGGCFTKENRISQVMYFDVIAYDYEYIPPAPPVLPGLTFPVHFPVRF